MMMSMMMSDFMVDIAVLCALLYICATSSYFIYCMLCKWRRKSTWCLQCTHCQQTLDCVRISDTAKISFDALAYLCVTPSGARLHTPNCKIVHSAKIVWATGQFQFPLGRRLTSLPRQGHESPGSVPIIVLSRLVNGTNNIMNDDRLASC